FTTLRPPSATLFPYTTLFRSESPTLAAQCEHEMAKQRLPVRQPGRTPVSDEVSEMPKQASCYIEERAGRVHRMQEMLEFATAADAHAEQREFRNRRREPFHVVHVDPGVERRGEYRPSAGARARIGLVIVGVEGRQVKRRGGVRFQKLQHLRSIGQKGVDPVGIVQVTGACPDV